MHHKGIRVRRQVTKWDCGLCCVAMISDREPEEMLRLFQEKTGCDSVWTIDLLNALEEQGVACEMLTRSLSISPAFSGLSYYSSTFARDVQRVETLLRNNPRAREEVLTTRELAGRMRRGETHSAIVLVCKRVLEKWKEQGQYVGHYILVVGVAEGDDEDTLLFFDPAHGEAGGLQRISVEELEKCRAVDGTDMDIILTKKVVKE